MATQPPVTDAPTERFEKIRLPKGTDSPIINQSIGLLTIVAACKAVHSQATTLLVTETAGQGEITMAAIVPASEVNHPASEANWATLRGSIEKMRPARQEALTDKEASIVDHVLKIVLDEMDTIERAQ